MLSPRHNHHGQKAFTLVELLIVIGIIALLISILLPSLARARQQAQAIVCLNNLRQIGTGVLMYTQDNNGYFPRASMTAPMASPIEYNSQNLSWGVPPTWYGTLQRPITYYGSYYKLNQIPRSAETILFGEINPEITGAMGDHFMVDTWNPDNFKDPDNPVTVAMNQHGKGSNYIYGDGHAVFSVFNNLHRNLQGLCR